MSWFEYFSVCWDFFYSHLSLQRMVNKNNTHLVEEHPVTSRNDLLVKNVRGEWQD